MSDALKNGAIEVVRILRKAGYEAYFAGGCVRDLLLGKDPKDYDIVTDALPEQVTALFDRTLQIGASFGVVKVLLGKRREYEVATYREDGKYSDGRRPDDVSYSRSREEDVKRRDFTINGLLFEPESEEVLDYVGGRADLEAQVIRAVGVPAERFAEDRLRMLRAVRFAVRFGFEIEPATFEAIRANAAGIVDVSAERIVQELVGIFLSDRPGDGMRMLADVGLMEHVLPFVRDAAWLGAAMDRLPGEGEVSTIAWALTVEGVPIEDVENVLRELKLSKEVIRGSQSLLRERAVLASGEEAARLRVAAEADERLPRYLACVQDSAADAGWQAARASIDASPLPSRPLLTGKDLQELGMKPGPEFKAILAAVDDAVLLRRVRTREEAVALVRSELMPGA